MRPAPERPRFPALTVAATLLRRGALLQLLLFLACAVVALLNRALMRIEDVLVPAIARTPLDRVVFILGHHRSGTTNLHKELRRHPDTVSGTMLDLLFPSLVLNRLVTSRPARWVYGLLDRGIRRLWNTPNHPVGFDEELEEHLWLLHRVRSEALVVLFPSLVTAGNRALFEASVSFTDEDFVFVRRCLQRLVYARTREGKLTWVGRPLMFTLAAADLSRHFPEAKLVVCLREPVGAVRSHVALTKNQMGCAADDPRLSRWAAWFLELGSRRQYQAMRELVSDETLRARTLAVTFEQLTRDTAPTLGRILDHAGLERVELPPVRSESHGVGDRVEILSREEIDAACGEDWRAIQQVVGAADERVAQRAEGGRP